MSKTRDAARAYQTFLSLTRKSFYFLQFKFCLSELEQIFAAMQIAMLPFMMLSKINTNKFVTDATKSEFNYDARKLL